MDIIMWLDIRSCIQMHFLSLLMCKILYITITNVISNKRILCTSRYMSMWSQNAMCRLTGAYSIYRGNWFRAFSQKVGTLGTYHQHWPHCSHSGAGLENSRGCWWGRSGISRRFLRRWHFLKSHLTPFSLPVPPTAGCGWRRGGHSSRQRRGRWR